jgi:hypothetical protein
MLSDKDIRTKLNEELRAFAPKKSVIINEYGVWNNRIDVALIENCLVGYEIKSDKDTLIRLPQQVDLYNKVFDYVSIVCTEKYITRIMLSVPAWYGIIEVYQDFVEICLKTIRTPIRNPNLNAEYLAGLLWRDESLVLLDKYSSEHGLKNKRKDLMHDKLCSLLSIRELHKEVINTLKQRDWSGRYPNRSAVEIIS